MRGRGQEGEEAQKEDQGRKVFKGAGVVLQDRKGMLVTSRMINKFIRFCFQWMLESAMIWLEQGRASLFLIIRVCVSGSVDVSDAWVLCSALKRCGCTATDVFPGGNRLSTTMHKIYCL